MRSTGPITETPSSVLEMFSFSQNLCVTNIFSDFWRECIEYVSLNDVLSLASVNHFFRNKIGSFKFDNKFPATYNEINFLFKFNYQELQKSISQEVFTRNLTLTEGATSKLLAQKINKLHKEAYEEYKHMIYDDGITPYVASKSLIYFLWITALFFVKEAFPDERIIGHLKVVIILSLLKNIDIAQSNARTRARNSIDNLENIQQQLEERCSMKNFFNRYKETKKNLCLELNFLNEEKFCKESIRFFKSSGLDQVISNKTPEEIYQLNLTRYAR